MFVLPPPPQQRYPSTPGVGPWGTPLPGPAQFVETNNTISKPTGPEFQFSVGEGTLIEPITKINAVSGALPQARGIPANMKLEIHAGTYVLKEDILLAIPQPHPTEAPVVNLNPLSTAPQPTVAGTKLSLVAIKYKDPPSHPYRNSAESQNRESQGRPGSRASADTDDRSSVGKTGSGSNTSRNGDGMTTLAEKFGGGNVSSSGKDAAKRKKPKNNIAKNNSTFVSKIIVSPESLTKRLAERNSEDLFVFANINRAFNWLDMGSATKVQNYRNQQSKYKDSGTHLFVFLVARTSLENPLHQSTSSLP